MERSRKIVLVAHCLLNVNSRVQGIARYPSIHPLICELAEEGFGVIQLPCPEIAYEGLDRDPQDIEYYDTPEYRDQCRTAALKVSQEVAEYISNDYEVTAVIGVEESPSCAVRDPGIFMQELLIVLDHHGIPFTSIDKNEDADGLDRIIEELTVGE
jgi:predicted secreted protein